MAKATNDLLSEYIAASRYIRRKIRALVLIKLSEGYTVEEVAKETGTSKSHICCIKKKYMGLEGNMQALVN